MKKVLKIVIYSIIGLIGIVLFFYIASMLISANEKETYNVFKWELEIKKSELKDDKLLNYIIEAKEDKKISLYEYYQISDMKSKFDRKLLQMKLYKRYLKDKDIDLNSLRKKLTKD